MDIEVGKKKRQLNVRGQRHLSFHEIRECAIAYRNAKRSLSWVTAALVQSGLDPGKGILISACTTPQGNGEEVAYAQWLTADRNFYSIVAIVELGPHSFISLESVTNVTASANVNNHVRGIGKSGSLLALEILELLI